MRLDHELDVPFAVRLIEQLFPNHDGGVVLCTNVGRAPEHPAGAEHAGAIAKLFRQGRNLPLDLFDLDRCRTSGVGQRNPELA